MVNENSQKFNQVQREHQGKYIGTNNVQKYGVTDPKYNNQKDTDKSVGTTGRNLN